jgi:hypothetical protein
MRILAALALLGLNGTDGGLGLPPFAPGEELLYEVTMLGAHVGTLRMDVRSPDAGEGWAISAEADSKGAFDLVYSLHDRLGSEWDPASQRATVGRINASEGDHRFEYAFRFQRSQPGPDGGIAVEVVHRDRGRTTTTTQSMDPEIEDFLGALYLLRTKPLVEKERDSIPVVMGDDPWTLGSLVMGKESVDAAGRVLPCVRLRLSVHFGGALKNRRDLDFYVTDDSSHIPVLLDSEFIVGHLQVRLLRARARL